MSTSFVEFVRKIEEVDTAVTFLLVIATQDTRDNDGPIIEREDRVIQLRFPEDLASESGRLNIEVHFGCRSNCHNIPWDWNSLSPAERSQVLAAVSQRLAQLLIAAYGINEPKLDRENGQWTITIRTKKPFT